MNVLLLSGTNHGFEPSAKIIHEFLSPELPVTLTDDKSVFTSPTLNEFDACILGTGFTRTVRQPDGTVKRESELSPEQLEGLFRFVRGGKGFVGIHGTGWWISGESVNLLGGHSNWHPPGSAFTVHVEDANHPVTQGIEDFEVEDEIYITAHDPDLRVLASAEWLNKAHPLAWVKPYGSGRVFYTALGHGPGTFQRPAMQRLMTQGVRWAAGTSLE